MVSRCSPTTQSTDNELRVIGYESPKMNSDYLRGAIPLAPFLLDVSVKNIWILKRVLCI